ncbi:response regulator [Massilia sp. 2TAF26]|uniref:response regulator n=1 Tax=Massilia sp. 2TAF26 TaxID=3233012 RepID=UPI003F98456F
MPLSTLLVENDPLTRQAVVYLLDGLKHVPVAFEDLACAAGVLESLRVDLAIISLGLRDPDGGTVAARLKKLQGHLKVIVVGGRQPQAPATSIDAWVQKPLCLKALAAAIERAMSPGSAGWRKW